MKDLDEAVKQYISTEQTDYALLLNGPWGCGKTYYYKTVITKLIQDAKLKPVFISLYGVASLDDISKKIFFEINPKLRKVLASSAVKKITGLAKTAISGVSVYNVQLDIPKIKFKEWLKMKNDHFVCFDDLERTGVDVKEALGFINNLVEHDQCKVMIIANETEIPDEDYSRIKEKVVGVTIEYQPDIKAILANLLSDYHSRNELYSFLSSKIDEICRLFHASGSNNIRILRHAIVGYSSIYAYLEKNEKKVRDQYADKLLYFYLAASYAIKTKEKLRIEKDPKSGDQAKDLYIEDELRQVRNQVHYEMRLYPPFSKEQDENGIQYFNKKYFEECRLDVYFSKAVLDYIDKGYLNAELLTSEIIKEAQVEEDETFSLLRKFQSEWWDLSDEEFKDVARALLDKIVAGDVILPIYPRLFSYYEKFMRDGIFDIETEDLLRKFREGMRKARQKTSYDAIKEQGMYEPMREDSPSEAFNGIKKEAESYIEDIYEEHFADRAKNIFELLSDDTDKFVELLREDKEQFSQVPIFKYYPMEALCSKILTLSNSQIVTFRVVLRARYKRMAGVGRLLKADKNSLEKLLRLLEGHLAKRDNSLLSTKLISELTNELKEYIAIVSVSEA